MPYLKNQTELFVILFEGRTASTFIAEKLNSHSLIKAHKEILGPLRNDPPYAQIKAARKVLKRKCINSHKAVGFKTKLRVINDPVGFAEVLHELNVKIIHMKRKNIVKTALSEIFSNMLKKERNNYNIYNENHKLGTVYVDFKDFNWTLHLREDLNSKLEDYVSRLNLPVLSIYYENILLDLEGTLKTIFDFIDVPYEKTSSEMVKHTNDNLREAISNFDELKSHYLHTKYEDMFDEVTVAPENFLSLKQ